MRTLDKFIGEWHGRPTLATDKAQYVCESRPDYPFRFTERHLQCAWFDPGIRPSLLETTRREPVIVEDPGRWNLEEGPDFVDASLIVGYADKKRRIRGDVEVHIIPADWQHHHHSDDPRYANVIAHVSFFEGNLPSGVLPAGSIEIALQPGLSVIPGFSFEAINTPDYPYAVRHMTPPCGRALAGCAPPRMLQLLEATGVERLRQKAERIANSIQHIGKEQALYEEMMCALGYKKNRLQFRRLARAVPFVELQDKTGHDALRACALLTGAAGLLPESIPPGLDAAAGLYMRRLWDQWWKNEVRHGGNTMSSSDWQLGRLRPQNHPLRRIAAAAAIFSRRPSLATTVRSSAGLAPAEWHRTMMSMVTGASDPFWDNRLSLATKPAPGRVALVGQARAASTITNVIIPFAVASDAFDGDGAELLRTACPDQENTITRRTAAALLGNSVSGDIKTTALSQQGLLQVFYDYCVNDRSSCHNCQLPGHIRAILT